MSRAIYAVAAIAGGALIALLLLAGLEERNDAFELPVTRKQPVAMLLPGQRACQRPLVAQEDFEIVRLTLAAEEEAEIGVEAVRSGRVPRARGRLRIGRSRSTRDVGLGPTVSKEERFELCVANEGGGRAAVYGAEARLDDLTAVEGNTARPNSDMALRFLRDRQHSLLSQTPRAFERAALFKPTFLGAWTFWLLALGVVIGVPALLSAALRDATRP